MKAVSGDKLTHEVQATSRTFYRNQDLEVIVGGDQAMTNGTTVFLPTIPLGVDYDEDEVRTIRGFVDHEAGHGRHTNFKLGRRKKYRDLIENVEHFMPITNGLEDVRIERLITKEYPGSKRNLEATSAWANKLYLNNREDTSKSPSLAEIGAVAITWEGRRRMGYDDPTIQECLDTLSPDVRQSVNEAVDMIDKAKSTKACMEASIELCKRWGLDYHEAEEQEREQEPEREQEEQEREEHGDGQGGQCDGDGDESQEQEQGEQGEQDSGDGDTAGQNQGDNADPDAEDMGDGSGEPEEQEATEGEGGGDNHDGQGTRADGDAEEVEAQSASAGHGFNPNVREKPQSPYDPNLDKAMENIVSSKGCYSGAYVPHGARFDVHEKEGQWESFTSTCIKAAKDTGEYEKVRKSIGGHMNKMRRNLERALIATQERTWRSGYEEGTLDSRRLARAINGESSVYRQRSQSEDMDTCVMLCLDASGSMRRRKAALAMQCAIAMGEVFEKAGIPYAVSAFNTMAHDNNNTREYCRTMNEYGHAEGRGHAISTYLFKDFHQGLRSSKHQIAAYEYIVGSGNTDGDSLMYIHQNYVMPRPEKRKIMFVFSDGLPVGTNEDAEIRRLSDVCRTIENSIELVGFGIQMNVERFYRNSVQVNDLDEMSGKVMKQVASMLLGKKFKVDAKEVAA